MLLTSFKNPDSPISQEQILASVKAAVATCAKIDKILIIPPDITRLNSGAGLITQIAVEYLKSISNDIQIDIIPALGTHFPMTDENLTEMFGDLPKSLFIDHNWQDGLTSLGEVPASFINEMSEGRLDFAVNIEINSLLVEGNYDLILSIGQVVPHEVIGMANGNKNIFVGVGGQDTINKTHFLGAISNMEKILGVANNPVRKVFNYAEEKFLTEFPLVYIQTVVDSKCKMQGIYAGTGQEPFQVAAKHSQALNITYLDKPLKKVVVYLDPKEFKSTWLGNKAIYRTRKVMADDGELIIIGPAVETFGEDPEIDRLIRKYGYCGTPATLAAIKTNPELEQNLSAAAHLIHGSSEGRFKIIYAPGHLSQAEVESVNFNFAKLDEFVDLYNPKNLKDGFNSVNGEEIFFISNPALGLWSLK